MVTVSLVFLLGLAVYVGLRWQLRSLAVYFAAVVGALLIWSTAIPLRQTYAVMLPLLFGTLVSLFLALVGLRAARRAGSEPDGAPELWVAGACLAIAPFVLVVIASIW